MAQSALDRYSAFSDKWDRVRSGIRDKKYASLDQEIKQQGLINARNRQTTFNQKQTDRAGNLIRKKELHSVALDKNARERAKADREVTAEERAAEKYGIDKTYAIAEEARKVAEEKRKVAEAEAEKAKQDRLDLLEKGIPALIAMAHATTNEEFFKIAERVHKDPASSQHELDIATDLVKGTELKNKKAKARKFLRQINSGLAKEFAEVKPNKPWAGRLNGRPVFFDFDEDGGLITLKSPEGIVEPPAKSQRDITVQTDADGNPLVTISEGTGAGAELTKPTLNFLQKEVAELAENEIQINEVFANLNDDFLTIPTQAFVEGADLAERLGYKHSDKNKKLLTEFTDFKTPSKKLTFAYRKKITGVAGALRELNDIEKTMLSMKTGYTIFKAKLRQLRRLNQHTSRIYKRMILENTVFPSEKSRQRRTNEIFESGTMLDMESRAEELMSEGLEGDALTKRLVAEGFTPND